jgi:hypothetical protein
VWFGDRRAPAVFRTDSTRVVAVTPPRMIREVSGPTGVRIANILGIREYVFKEAYTYRPPSQVPLALEPVARIQRAYDGYRGTIAISLDLADVRVDAGAFYLRAEPALLELEGSVVPGTGLVQAGRSLQMTRYGAGVFRLVIGPGEPLTGKIELGLFSWRLPNPPSDPSLRWFVLYPDIRVLWGGNVDVVLNDVAANLNELGAKSVPSRPPDPAERL